MRQVLYAGFLENKRIYNLNQASWKRLIDRIAQKHNFSYTSYLNELQNGEKEYDGNPIFNVFVPELNRAVRIIQVTPQGEDPDISYWLDDIELEQGKEPVDELVLDLVLSRETKKIAKELIILWLVDRVQKEEIEAYQLPILSE